MSSRLWNTAVWFHRWAGIALCLFFAMWFATGMVMVFVPFPGLDAEERLAASQPIDLARLTIAPADIVDEADGANGIRLTGIRGRPVYVISKAGERDAAYAGDTREQLSLVSAETATAIAEAFEGQASLSTSEAIDYDQWIVYDRFDPVRPLYPVSFGDQAGTVLYVSAVTGEVLQKTERKQRMWNWVGAIPHWIYFTPIRRDWALWDNLVWWISLVATAAVLTGIVIGVIRFAQARTRRRLSPFQGWMRWHHVMGVFFGLFVFIGIFSGWLSMDHGRLFSTPAATTEQQSRFAGVMFATVLRSIPLAAIQQLPDVVELNFNAVAGNAVVAAGDSSADVSVYLLDDGQLTRHETLPLPLLESAVTTAFPGEDMIARGRTQFGDFYPTAEELPSGVRLFSSPVTGREVYVDGLTGRISAVMDSSRRSYAWLYYALHTFRFPGMYLFPALRIVLLIMLTAIGFAFSVTGIIIAYKRLRA